MKKTLFLICSLLILSACSSHTDTSSASMKVSKNDSDYKKGMKEACRPIDCGYTRDLNRFKNSESYRQGWYDGLMKCKGIEKGEYLNIK